MCVGLHVNYSLFLSDFNAIWYFTHIFSENLQISNLFTSKLDLNLRKKLIKCYIWSMALYGAETWTLRAADQKYLESFEMWWWRRMEKISWTDM